MFDVSKQLSVFVGLIITNCIVMGRLEAFAMGNPPWKSFLDGLANGVGYSAILILIGIVREIFGSGTLLGHHVIPASFYAAGYVNNGMMVLAPGAFFLLGSSSGSSGRYRGTRKVKGGQGNGYRSLCQSGHQSNIC